MPMPRAEVLADDHQASSQRPGWYLCYFLHRLLDFRIPDVESVLEMLGLSLDQQVKWRLPCGGEHYSPFWYIRLPSEEVVRQLADRAMLTRVRVMAWRRIT